MKIDTKVWKIGYIPKKQTGMRTVVYANTMANTVEEAIEVVRAIYDVNYIYDTVFVCAIDATKEYK